MTWWIYCLNKEQPTKAKTSLKAMATSPDAMHDLNKQTKKQRNKKNPKTKTFLIPLILARYHKFKGNINSN